MANLFYQFNSTHIYPDKLSVDDTIVVDNIYPLNSDSLHIGKPGTKVFLGSSLYNKPVSYNTVPLTKFIISDISSAKPTPIHLNSLINDGGINGWYCKGIIDSYLLWNPIMPTNSFEILSEIKEIFICIRIISNESIPYITISQENYSCKYIADPSFNIDINSNYLFKIPFHDVSNSFVDINHFSLCNMIQDEITGVIDQEKKISINIHANDNFEFILNSIGIVYDNNIKIYNFNNSDVLAQYNLDKLSYLYDLLLKQNI